MNLIDAALADAGTVVRVSRERLLQFRLLDGEDFLDLGSGKAYGVINRTHNMAENVKSFIESNLADVIEFRRELKNESDRGCALFAAAYLDKALSDLLYVHLVASKTIEKDLFEGTSPLSTFSSRITLSFYLGLISESCRRDLDLIRKIRNDFAHKISVKSFDQEKISQRCRGFYFSYREKNESPKLHFITAVIGVLSMLVSATLTTSQTAKKCDDRPSEDEKKAHRDFIKSLQNAENDK